MTTTEDDGFVTVTRTTPDTFSREYEDAAFKAHMRLDSVNFYLLLTYKNGSRQNLCTARNQLAEALSLINSALGENDQ